MDDRRRKWVAERKRIGGVARGRAGVIGKNKEKDTLCLSTTRQQLGGTRKCIPSKRIRHFLVRLVISTSDKIYPRDIYILLNRTSTRRKLVSHEPMIHVATFPRFHQAQRDKYLASIVSPIDARSYEKILTLARISSRVNRL